MMMFDPKTVKIAPRQYQVGFCNEMEAAGLSSYKAKKIKDLPWLIGIAKSLDTVGCMTIRDGDIAVYPSLSLREVIASFKNNDGVAAVNCRYFTDDLRKAAEYLRKNLE